MHASFKKTKSVSTDFLLACPVCQHFFPSNIQSLPGILFRALDTTVSWSDKNVPDRCGLQFGVPTWAMPSLEGNADQWSPVPITNGGIRSEGVCQISFLPIHLGVFCGFNGIRETAWDFWSFFTLLSPQKYEPTGLRMGFLWSWWGKMSACTWLFCFFGVFFAEEGILRQWMSNECVGNTSFLGEGPWLIPEQN